MANCKFVNMEGKILGGRYEITKFLNRGKNGYVYEVVDIKKTSKKKLVIKIQVASDEGYQEINTLF